MKKQQQPPAPRRYRITFYGRTKGAIGIDYEITAEREGATFDDARLALYDEYEHVHVMRFEDMARDQVNESEGRTDADA